MPLVKSGCIGCGQCIAACPTGALYTGNETDAVWCVLSDRAYPAVAVVTPEVFDQVSKIFHASHTDEDAGKLVSLLKRIGFSKVYSTEQIKRLRASYMNEEKGGNELVLDISCPAASKYVSEHLVSLNAKISQIPSAVKLISKALKKNNKAIHIVYISNCTSVKMAKSELGIDAAITIPELSEVIYRACVSRATALDVWRRIEMSKLDVVDMPSASADGSAFGKVERYSISEIDDFVKRVTEGERHGGIVRLTGCPGGCSNGGGRFREPPKG
jgi:iron only hydrogenase large subunit-like protein